MSSDSAWRLRLNAATFLSRDLWAGVVSLGWAALAINYPGLGLDAIVSNEAAAAFGTVALSFWYFGARNGAAK